MLLLILHPAAFGATVALIYLSFSGDNVSIISLGIGSVILGITVDYALHLITHHKHQSGKKQSAGKVTKPILMSSFTTAVAFLCLTLLSSPAIKQLGIFATISVLAAALLTVLGLPVFLWKNKLQKKHDQTNFIEKIAGLEFGRKKIIFSLIVIVTIVLYFFSGNARFEKDIEKSNYMPDNLIESQNTLNKIKSQKNQTN